MGISCADVEFAGYGSDAPCAGAGIISRDFTTKNPARCQLVLGNELLYRSDEGYPKDPENKFAVPEHTVNRVLEVLSQRFLTTPSSARDAAEGKLQESSNADISRAPELFVGFLMLDALIGNTDRHHENWGILERFGERTVSVLAPSFDHASCLGRELTDRARKERLQTKNEQFSVKAYAERAKSKLHRNTYESKPLTPLEAFLEAGNSCSDAADYWLARLTEHTEEIRNDIVSKVPDFRMSTPAREFCLKFLHINHERLLQGLHS